MSTPKRRAFFDPGPILRQPGADERFVSFAGSWQGLLNAPAQPSQQPVEVVGVVVHAKLVLDDLPDPAQRPPIGGEAGCQRPAPQYPSQHRLVGPRQPGRASWGFAAAQGTQAAVGETFGPVAHSGAADAQLSRNFSLRQPAGSQKLGTRSATFFHLFAREVLRFPSHASKCKSI